MNLSQTYDPELHPEGSAAAGGRCSYHAGADERGSTCAGEAVVSYQDSDGNWHSGCSVALKELVDAEQIEPLGQGA